IGEPLGKARLWDLNTGKEMSRLPGPTAGSVVFSPDGRTLATGDSDGRVCLWDLASGKEVRRLGAEHRSCWSLAYSPDGRLLATVADDKAVHLWDTATGKEVRKLRGQAARTPSLVRVVAFSHDGKLLATGSFPDRGTHESTVCLWEVATRQQI